MIRRLDALLGPALDRLHASPVRKSSSQVAAVRRSPWRLGINPARAPGPRSGADPLGVLKSRRKRVAHRGGRVACRLLLGRVRDASGRRKASEPRPAMTGAARAMADGPRGLDGGTVDRRNCDP